jgi:hypothetical protein
MAALPVGMPPPVPCGVDLRARRLDKVPRGIGHGARSIGSALSGRRRRTSRIRRAGRPGRRRGNESRRARRPRAKRWSPPSDASSDRGRQALAAADGPVPAPSLGRGRSGPLPRTGRPRCSAGQRRREPARARRTSTRWLTTAAVETPCGPLPIRDGWSGRRRGTIPCRRSRRTIVVGPEDTAGAPSDRVRRGRFTSPSGCPYERSACLPDVPAAVAGRRSCPAEVPGGMNSGL